MGMADDPNRRPNALVEALMGLRDRIPENTEHNISLANVLRGGLGTAAGWMDWRNKMSPDDYSPQEVMAPLGASALGIRMIPKGSIGSGFADPLYHGSSAKGLTELNPSVRGPLGPGVYTSPAEQISRGYYAGPEGHVYTLPERERDIYRGHGHRTDDEWLGFKADKQRLVDAADPEKRAAVAEIVDKMWSTDGYPLYQRLRQLYGSDDAAQDLYKKAGFEGISGLVDGPEVVLFGAQPVRR